MREDKAIVHFELLVLMAQKKAVPIVGTAFGF